MSILFGRVPFVWRIFDDIDGEEQEDFLIEEIRCCNCFFDKIAFVIEENSKLTFRKLYENFPTSPRRFTNADFFMYFSKISIFCCETAKNFFGKCCEIDKDEMDKHCLAEAIDYCCLYFLSRETVFNCICDNCQKTLLKIVSEKLLKFKI